jgi:hypothetical protein
MENNITSSSIPENIWEEAIIDFETNLQRQCIEVYRQHINQLKENKKFVSLKLMNSTHEIATDNANKFL